ncbi:MAG: hypothetical protein AAF562_00275 [Pseudomonadota bacterium]
MTPSEVKDGIQGLGWFLRRSIDPLTSADFYEHSLGLVRLRQWDVEASTGVMLWTGFDSVLETNRLADIQPGEAVAPQDSQVTPIWRTYDMADSLARLERGGTITVKREPTAQGEVAWFDDPLGYPCGLEFVAPNAAEPMHQRNQAAWEKGPETLPGGLAIRGPVQGIHRLDVRCTALEEESKLLAALGLEALNPDQTCFALSASTMITLVPTQTHLPAVTEREQVPDSWVMRVYGMAQLQTRAQNAGRPLLSQHHFPGGDLDYIVTPSNCVIGWQERKPYDALLPTTQFIEDLAARSAWHDTKA